MTASRTAVFLRELRIRRDGTLYMVATQGFLNTVRGRVGSPANCHLRVGTFDFYEVRKNVFHGVPDEHGPEAPQEAVVVCNRVLAIYRSILLFEALFHVKGSFNNWVIFNKRTPTPRDLADMARERKVYIPFMALPYKQPPVDIEGLLERASLTAARQSQARAKTTTPRHTRPATLASLQALVQAYQR